MRDLVFYIPQLDEIAIEHYNEYGSTWNFKNTELWFDFVIDINKYDLIYIGAL